MNTSRISQKPFHLLLPFGLALALFAGPAGGAMNPKAAPLLQTGQIIQTSLGKAAVAAACIVPGGEIPASGCLPPPPRPAKLIATAAKN